MLLTILTTYQPAAMIVTTANVKYNARFETLPAGRLQYKDHRFEWTRTQFQASADSVSKRFGYLVSIAPVGADDEGIGAPTQMGVLRRNVAV